MERVTGPPLTELVDGRLLDVPDVVRMGRLLIEAVGAAHDVGLIHRDLKPDNILLEGSSGVWVPRITDFGLARALTVEGTRYTRKGTGLGTPAYMAPEQWQDARSVDHRAGVFSLGAILYEVACGRMVFDGADHAQVYKQVTGRNRLSLDTHRPELSPGIVEAIDAALEPDRSLRVQSCEELLDLWLSDDIEETTPPAPPPEPAPSPAPAPAPAPTASSPRLLPRLVAVSAVLAAVLIGLPTPTAPVDLYLYRQVRRAVLGPLVGRNTALLPLELRGGVIVVLAQLRDHDAADVLLDVPLSPVAPTDDALAEVLAAAELPVYAAGTLTEDALIGPEHPGLAEHLVLGLGITSPDAFQVHASTATHGDVWALAVARCRPTPPPRLAPATATAPGACSWLARTTMPPGAQLLLDPVEVVPQLDADP